MGPEVRKSPSRAVRELFAAGEGVTRCQDVHGLLRAVGALAERYTTAIERITKPMAAAASAITLKNYVE